MLFLSMSDVVLCNPCSFCYILDTHVPTNSTTSDSAVLKPESKGSSSNETDLRFSDVHKILADLQDHVHDNHDHSH